MDGTIFNNKYFVLNIGYLVDNYDTKQGLLNPINHKLYWHELYNKKNDTHYFKLLDYLWRWNVDCYYVTMPNVGENMGNFFRNETIRQLTPRFIMNDITLKLLK